MNTPNPDIPNIPNSLEVGMHLSFGPARPVVLFPVRLETRFFLQADGSSELRIRVYPDQAHINSHEPKLTADELIWGQHFWEQTWRAGNDEERGKTAWRQLADRFDPPRAAWIARALKPLNPDDLLANPAKPPRFPSLATKDEAWTSAPVASALPNLWVALGYKNGQLIVNAKGGLIPDTLAAGPTPSPSADPNPSPSANVDQFGVDDGMKWMVDFDEAERVGMGIRARLRREEAAAGLDFLLVMGIKDSPGGTTDWTPLLAELFDAHHYTGGLSFVPQGAPSNNTADAPSAFSSKDPGHEASYLAERAAPVFQPGDGSNADALATAFGLANAGQVFANLPNAMAKDQLDARHMNTALWQATLGYFLSQMIGVVETGASPLTDGAIAWAREHFIDYVRAAGPLPAVRIGKQPYGVLPVTSLDAWRAPAGQESQYGRDIALQDLLIRLRKIWRRNYLEVPRLGRTEDVSHEMGQENGIDKDLAEVLSMDGLSGNYSIRNLMGGHYLEHLLVFLSSDHFRSFWDVDIQTIPGDIQLTRRKNAFNNWWVSRERLTGTVLETMEVAWHPRLARAVFSPPVVKLNGALAQADQSSSLKPNYIESLLAARDLKKIQEETILQPPPRTLLYLLLRHSMLVEYVAAASRLLILPASQRREPELVNLREGQVTQTVWEWMKINISVTGAPGPMPVGKYLLGFLPTGEPDVARVPDLKPLSDFRGSLGHLKSLDVDRLEKLMTGTLDLCSHRVDAWITSFATKRLAEMRKANPAGALFGGYGWVMNLKPADTQNQVTPPPGEQAPVFQLANNPGFVHTPSLAQASTVAILRSGHLAHSGNQNPNDLLSIDLSSERVRLVKWLLDGVRQGQPLGALLGYRFERRLLEAGKAKFIASFRELAPLVARKLEQSDQPVTEPVEAVAANNVVDGLALLRRWQKGKGAPPQWNKDTIPFGQQVGQQTIALPPADPNNLEYNAIQSELAVLEDAVDAVSDALMAESVYQVVRGNPLRAASTVESIAGGETPPPEIEVTQTPRTGVALTHRLVTLFSGAPALPLVWKPPPYPQRANAEPHLNAWAARLLGNLANVRCVVERLEPATGNVLESKELRLHQLLLAPLDFIYAVEGGQGGQQAEIEQRILYTMTRLAGAFAPGSLLRVSSKRKPEWKASELSYGEFNEVLRTARRMISAVRAIDAADLNLPERKEDFSVDVAELESRAGSASQWFQRTLNELRQLLHTPETASLESLRDWMMRAATFGVPGAIPLSAAGDSPSDREILLTQASSIEKELRQRFEQYTALASGFNPNTATPEDRRRLALARMGVVFGKAFVMLPRFTAVNAVELERALADSAKAQDGDPLASTTWFQRMARVRDGVARLNATLNYAEALNTGEKLRLTIAQLPYSSDDRWVGLALKSGQNLPGGKLSLVVQSSAPIDVRQPLAGLLIDEWVEVVPSATETTGIALQYDHPSSAPPQTILVAVPPEVELPWTVWSLQQVLLETLDLARIRAVDPDALDEVGHYLPALYFACNTAGETVSTDFTKVK